MCRICGLPRKNECSCCKKPLDQSARFCKYCGAMSIYFKLAVSDPKECELAKRFSKKTISEWKKHGVRYLNIEDEHDYVQQLDHYGEIVHPYY